MSDIAKLTAALSKKIAGKEDTAALMVTALLAGGHILIEDVPGVGKTTLAKSLAFAIDLPFARIQCTPDTLPSDITGASVFNPKTSSFDVVLGPVTKQIVLADEINRTSPRTQAALLEAMEERQVTIDGQSYPIAEPFLVIATQNPMDFAGTWPLPEAELDRFMLKLSVGYPSDQAASEMVDRMLTGVLDAPENAVMTGADIMELREKVKKVHVSNELREYILKIVKETRLSGDTKYGASPRAALDLVRASQALAVQDGRDYVSPDDIASLAAPVLSHRLILTEEAMMEHITGKNVIDACLRKTPVPK